MEFYLQSCAERIKWKEYLHIATQKIVKKVFLEQKEMEN